MGSPRAVLIEMPHIKLEWTDDERVLQGRRARWFREHGVIAMRANLRRVIWRSSVAHELGHIVLEHPDACGVEFFDNRVELEADQFAARLLLDDVEELASELATTSNHRHAATNLYVTIDVLEARLACLTTAERLFIGHWVEDVHRGVGA